MAQIKELLCTSDGRSYSIQIFKKTTGAIQTGFCAISSNSLEKHSITQREVV